MTLNLCAQGGDFLRVTIVAAFPNVNVVTFQYQRRLGFRAVYRFLHNTLRHQWNDLHGYSSMQRAQSPVAKPGGVKI